MVGFGIGCSNNHSLTPKCKALNERKEVALGTPHISKKFIRVMAPSNTSNHAKELVEKNSKAHGTNIATTPTRTIKIPYIK
jgi:hypothetical protein